jgi:plastocyanin domain-containing protein
MNRAHILGLMLIVTMASACERGKGAPQGSSTAASAGATSAGGPIAITVDGSGYQPSSVTAPAGKAVKLVFTRTSDDGCGQQLVFPALDIRRDLPLNQPVTIDVTMPASGSVSFTCGMDMYRGAVVVQ